MERALDAVEENSLDKARSRRQEIMEATGKEEEAPSPLPRVPKNPFSPLM
jgi:hypothetical protein